MLKSVSFLFFTKLGEVFIISPSSLLFLAHSHEEMYVLSLDVSPLVVESLFIFFSTFLSLLQRGEFLWLHISVHWPLLLPFSICY